MNIKETIKKFITNPILIRDLHLKLIEDENFTFYNLQNYSNYNLLKIVREMNESKECKLISHNSKYITGATKIIGVK